MRIIAKQNDYYDYSMAYGIDKTVVYKRDPDLIEGFPREYAASADKYVNLKTNKSVSLHKFTVFICGERHILFAMSDNPSNSDYDRIKVSKGYEFPRFYRFWNLSNDDSQQTDFSHVNEEYDSPIVIFGAHPKYSSSEDNASIVGVCFGNNFACKDAPILQYLGFPDLIPGEQIYQKIDSWVSNKRNNDPVVFEDKYKIQSAGFDVKKSFRKMDRD